ncbi:hypothetical protein ABID56_002311 [Alkalibacillus flavidus]|uniref:Uncharacterized protein n=1 Tax=Alkalibacillus flavidus TaxID=546021 RepID=A0ABV2KX75_9BACI
MKKIHIMLIVAIVSLAINPFAIQAETTEEEYRLAVGNLWYPVSDEYDKLEMPYLSYTFDAVFAEDEDEKAELTNQLDQTVANELWDFFNREDVKQLAYTDDVLDYLDSNFDIDKNEGGFWSWFGRLFSWIGNLFA